MASKVLQPGLADDRVHVTDYMGGGGYPEHCAEKEEAEGFAADVVDAIRRRDAPELAVDLRHYLRAMFPPEQLQAAREAPRRFARQVAFAALQRALDEALYRPEELVR